MNLNEKLENLRDLFHGPITDENFFKRMDIINLILKVKTLPKKN